MKQFVAVYLICDFVIAENPHVPGPSQSKIGF